MAEEGNDGDEGLEGEVEYITPSENLHLDEENVQFLSTFVSSQLMN